MGSVESLFQFLPCECCRPHMTAPSCPGGGWGGYRYHLSFCRIDNNINRDDDDFIILASAWLLFGDLGPCGVRKLSLYLPVLPRGMIVCVLNACVCLCVCAPFNGLAICPGCIPASQPVAAGIDSSSFSDFNSEKVAADGEMLFLPQKSPNWRVVPGLSGCRWSAADISYYLNNSVAHHPL